MTRISRELWAMELATTTAKRSTCLRRSVGCVLLNARGHVLATGYNGVPAGMKHCNEAAYRNDLGMSSPVPIIGMAAVAPIAEEFFPHACPGSEAASGTNLDGCHAIHAEQNALLQCRDVNDIEECFVTARPCMTCTKLLLNTSCKWIRYRDEYPDSRASDLWFKSGRGMSRVG